MAETLEPDELEIWMSLIRICQLLPDRLDEQLRRAGSSLPQYEILAVLATAPDGLRISELAALALVSKPRMTVHVGELVSGGLIDRRPDPDDGRATIVSLTEAGRVALDRWSPGHVALAKQLVVDHLGQRAGRDVLRASLHRIRGALDDTWEPSAQITT